MKPTKIPVSLRLFVIGLLAHAPATALHAAAHSAESAVFALDLRDAVTPRITTQPLATTTVTVDSPTTRPEIRLTVVAEGLPAPSYQWFRNGVAVPGQTTATLSVPASSTTAGSYAVRLENNLGFTVSRPSVVNVVPGNAFSALAIRASMAAAQTLIVGASVSGGTKNILFRASGPALGQFNLVGMADPRLELWSGENPPRLLIGNDNWPASLAPTIASVGLFPFAPSSLDAALAQTVGGSFSAQVRGTGAGIVLVEAYEVTTSITPRLTNISARNRVGTEAEMMFAGLIIKGVGSKQVLIRAVGPGLAGFGVGGVLADPQLEVFSSEGTRMATNDNWDSNATPQALFDQVAAFRLTPNSRDSALLLTLPVGTYTLQVSGISGGTGEALVEVYEVF